ncbi:unnamed protein product [Brassica oleracea var. botrytis]
MDRNLSFGSSASSRNRFDVNSTEAPLCHCARRTKKIKAWTDDNPGRRFFRLRFMGFLRGRIWKTHVGGRSRV